MYHGKRIGVFVSHVFGEYQRRVCQGIIDRAKEFGSAVELYASLMDGEDLGTYAAGEFGVLSVPNFESLDGAILLTGTYLSAALRNQILALLKKQKDFPVVEITNDPSFYPTIRFDNNTMTGRLAAHMIDVHDAKRLCFLGCSIERKFSDIRERAFRTVMEEQGLLIGGNDIMLSTYDPKDIRTALSIFTADGVPDAILCYNDRMAYLLLEAAQEAGYSVPEDFGVTGCDDLFDSGLITPALTTVTFPVESLGTAAVDELQLIWQGQPPRQDATVTAEPVIRCSCGCTGYKTPETTVLRGRYERRIDLLEHSIMRSMNLSASLQDVGDIDDALDTIANYIIQKDDCSEFYLCLYSDWNSVSSHILELTESDEEEVAVDSMLMKLGIQNGKRVSECEFQKNSLLPPAILKNPAGCYLFTPLYFNEKSFGYVAIAYADDRLAYHFQSVQLLMNLNRFLQSVREKKSTDLLIRRLETIYLRDALTGLFNKHGFEPAEEALVLNAKDLEVPLCCFFLDMDGLKTINDSFGHSEGDFALRVIGQAVKNACKPEDLAARFSGDEFYILGIDYSEEEAADLLRDIQSYLSNYNRLSDKPYRVSVSGGFSIFPAEEINESKTVYEQFSKADAKMYEEKKRKVKDIIK